MNMLKEMIEKRFEFDVDKARNSGGFGTPYPYDYVNGARWQHNQLKSEVLPILLECVEALEFFEDLDKQSPVLKLTSPAIQALERLRKWSES